MQIKKEVSLILAILLIALSLTGCSQMVSITLNEDASGTYEEVFTISKGLWDRVYGEIGNDDMVKEYISSMYQGADITIQDTEVNGTASKELTMKLEFQDFEGFQKVSNTLGAASIRFDRHYYSKTNIYLPETEIPADDDASEDINTIIDGDSSIEDMLGTLIGDDPELLAELSKEMADINIQTTITFPYAVKDTNGTLQEDGRTVTWSITDMQQLTGDGEMRQYAVFEGPVSDAAPVFSGAADKAAYNTGITLNIISENLLDKVTVNGQETVSDQLFLSEEGSYRIIASDINGNQSTIRFSIDTTKPTIKGVKNNKTYHNARTIRFSDKGSGIKKARLNGKKIANRTRVSKKGSYTLKVTDKAGNQKTLKFKIK